MGGRRRGWELSGTVDGVVRWAHSILWMEAGVGINAA